MRVPLFECMLDAACSMPADHICSSAQRSTKECVGCRFYGETIPGYVLSERIASYVHLFNLYWYVRYVGSGCAQAQQ